MQCLTSAGCTASAGTTLTFSPRAGATIVNPNQVSFPFVTIDTNTQVGTCVTNQFGVQCTLTSDVSLAFSQKLIANANGSGVGLYVPFMLEAGTAVGEFSWYDPSGMTGNNPTTENLTAVVHGYMWP